MRKHIPWYQNLQIIAWVAGGLTAAGALIVGTARYINLPREVEAAVQKNTQQDDALSKLGTIAEQNQKLLDKWDGIYQQQQQQAPNQLHHPPTPRESPAGLREWDEQEQTTWCCPVLDRQRCFDQNLWRRGCE